MAFRDFPFSQSDAGTSTTSSHRATCTIGCNRGQTDAAARNLSPRESSVSVFAQRLNEMDLVQFKLDSGGGSVGHKLGHALSYVVHHTSHTADWTLVIGVARRQ